MPDASSLVEVLRRHALRDPNRRALTFLPDGEREGECFTRGMLDERARAIAAGLQALDLCGERVLLVQSSAPEFITSFVGCLYAGAVPVPAHPPRLDRHLDRLRGIVGNARPKLALATATQRVQPGSFTDDSPDGPVWRTVDRIAGCAAAWREPPLTPDSLAFLHTRPARQRSRGA